MSLKKRALAIQHLDTNNVFVVRHFEHEIPRQLKELLLSREYIQPLKLSRDRHQLMRICNWQPNDLTQYQGAFTTRLSVCVYYLGQNMFNMAHKQNTQQSPTQLRTQCNTCFDIRDKQLVLTGIFCVAISPYRSKSLLFEAFCWEISSPFAYLCPQVAFAIRISLQMFMFMEGRRNLKQTLFHVTNLFNL